VERLLTEILEEMQKQTALLERLVNGAASRDAQTEAARLSMKKAALLLQGTPFGPLIESALKGGTNGQ
jgi:hypothetical protein